MENSLSYFFLAALDLNSSSHIDSIFCMLQHCLHDKFHLLHVLFSLIHYLSFFRLIYFIMYDRKVFYLSYLSSFTIIFNKIIYCTFHIQPRSFYLCFNAIEHLIRFPAYPQYTLFLEFV